MPDSVIFEFSKHFHIKMELMLKVGQGKQARRAFDLKYSVAGGYVPCQTGLPGLP
jgi:hypothetical protein